MDVFKYDDINVKKINYEKPVKNGSFYYSPISYLNKPLQILSPKMKCISDVTSEKNYLECETLNDNFKFYDFFINIENKNIYETFTKNKEWFDKEIPLELIDDMYKRTLKPIKKDSKPKFNFKIPFLKTIPQCKIYDQNQICVDLSRLKEDTEIMFILHIKGLKFLKQHYYCDCYISQIKLFDSVEKYTIFDKCMIEDIEPKKDDIDILDDEILYEINENKRLEILKENKKKEIEEKINELQKELQNL